MAAFIYDQSDIDSILEKWGCKWGAINFGVI